MRYFLLLLIFIGFGSIAFASDDGNDGDPKKFSLPSLSPKTAAIYANKLKEYLDSSDTGRSFLKDKKLLAMPNTPADLRLLFAEYEQFYSAQKSSKISQQQFDEIQAAASRNAAEIFAEEKRKATEDAERQVAIAKQNAEMQIQRAQQQTQDTLAKMGAVLAAGAQQQFSNQQVNEIVKSMTENDNIQVKKIALVDGLNGEANQFVF
jgi:hypothetical protein